MSITRHPVDLSRLKIVFQSNQRDFDASLEQARQNPQMLYLFLGHAATIYLSGSVVAPESPEVARALKLAAQAGTAIFVFQRIETPPRQYILGEGQPITFTSTASRSTASFVTWKKVFDLCLVTRQRHLSDELCQVSNEIFRRSDIVGAAKEDYTFADLLRAVWTDEQFTRSAAFVRTERDCPRWIAENKNKPCYVSLVTLPYLNVLRQLELRDESGFTNAITQAIQGHKKYWSSKTYAKQFNGFIALSLIAAAALAWDRGMRFSVDSEYLPMSWVRGDLLQ